VNFDRIAPHYRWIEGLLAGGQLQGARTAWLDAIRGHHSSSRVLIIGEGNGRFLQAFIQQCPNAAITCLDSSPRMIELARSRLGSRASNIEWVCAKVLQWKGPPKTFDLVVTHFFFDCFEPDQVEAMVHHLAPMASPKAEWLMADFTAPDPGSPSLLSRGLLALLFAFFNQTANVTARTLTPPDSWLQQQGFHLHRRRPFAFGLLHSDWWRRE
jgi:ubiquinone/menaquinone biosynthesis C-methylase UbiE